MATTRKTTPDAPDTSPTAGNGQSPLINLGGAPMQNRNAMRHGMRAGQLPKGASYITRETGVLRRALEDAVVDAGGGISIPDAASHQQRDTPRTARSALPAMASVGCRRHDAGATVIVLARGAPSIVGAR